MLRYDTEAGYQLVWCNQRAGELFSLPTLTLGNAPIHWKGLPLALSSYLSHALPSAMDKFEETLDPYLPEGPSGPRYQVRLLVDDGASEDRHFLLVFADSVTWSTGTPSELDSRKLESIGELASGVAHDFNNLIMGIQANAEALLSRETRGQDYQNLLVNIIRACGTGTSLTRSLLGYAKRQPLAIARFDLVELVKDVANIARLSLASGNHRLLPDASLADGAEPIMVDGCYSSLSHCLLNLIKNAREALPAGGGIHLRYLGDEATVRIEVRDDGKGIPEGDLPRIFEPFFSTKKQGTGLGLAMVRGIMAQHSGSIEITSSVGIGTSVMLVWPRALAKEDASAASPEEKTPDPRRSTDSIMQATTRPANLPVKSEPLLAFVVDDDELVRGGVQGLLEHLQYRVECYASGEEALDALNPEALPELIVLDYNMPGMDGTEFIRYWCEELPESYREHGTRILLVSGFPPSQFQSLMNKYAGMNVGLLQKPFSLHTLQRKLQDFGSLRSITGRIRPFNPKPPAPIRAKVKKPVMWANPSDDLDHPPQP
jgi:signal transduction histidine kinase